MAIHKLSAKAVEAAKPKEKEYNLSDGSGLYLRVKVNGSKLWIFNYTTIIEKKRKNMSLGAFPFVTLAGARAKHKELKSLLSNDIDPAEYKKEQARLESQIHQQTFEATAAAWLEKKKTEIKLKTAESAWSLLANHAFPAFGKLPVSHLKATHVIEMLRPIEAKGSLETVKRVCQRVNEVMTYAINCGMIDANPLANIRQAFKSPKKESMPTLKPRELPELMKALNRASIKTTTRGLIEFQLHTMTRPNESAMAEWTEINIDEQIWIIPASRMKKNNEHRIPLSPQTIELLEVMKPISGNGKYIFPADRNPNSHTNLQTANMAIKRMGFKGRLVAHGMRSIASTTLNEQGYDFDVIEAALSHVDANDVRRAYNRTDYFERRRIMMIDWSNHIIGAAMGTMSLSGAKPLKVVELMNQKVG